MPNESITIRFAEHDLNAIDKKEKNLDILHDIAVQKEITMEDVRKSIREVRPKVYKEVYGDD